MSSNLSKIYWSYDQETIEVVIETTPKPTSFPNPAEEYFAIGAENNQSGETAGGHPGTSTGHGGHDRWFRLD